MDYASDLVCGVGSTTLVKGKGSCSRVHRACILMNSLVPLPNVSRSPQDHSCPLFKTTSSLASHKATVTQARLQTPSYFNEFAILLMGLHKYDVLFLHPIRPGWPRSKRSSATATQ